MNFRAKNVLAVLALVAGFAVTRLAASPIAIGSFSYIYSDSVLSPGFGVSNYTGVASSCGATVTGPNTDCYPVTQELTFGNVVLSVNYSIGGVAQTPLVVSVPNTDSGLFAPSYNGCGTFGVDANCGDPNYAWQVPGLEDLAGGNVLVTSATLTGSFTPTQFNLTDGSLYTSTGTFTATLAPAADCPGNTDLNGNPTSDCYGDATDLVTNLSSGGGASPVPEPGTLAMMLGGVLIGLGYWRRLMRQR